MAAMTVSPELLTVPEAATVAGVSVRTMRRWAGSGQVRTTGSGHRRRVVAASLSEVAATNGRNGHDVVTRDRPVSATTDTGSEEHTSELQSHSDLVCRLLLEKKK